MLFEAPLKKELKSILLSYDGFFIPFIDRYGQESPIKTSWGISDICFYNINKELLSYSMNHEEWLFVDLIKIPELGEFKLDAGVY